MSDRGAEHQGGPSPPTPYPSVHLDGVHVSAMNKYEPRVRSALTDRVGSGEGGFVVRGLRQKGDRHGRMIR